MSQSLLICSLEQVGWAETLSPSPQLRDYEWEAPCLVVNEYSRSNSGPHGFPRHHSASLVLMSLLARTPMFELCLT